MEKAFTLISMSPARDVRNYVRFGVEYQVHRIDDTGEMIPSILLESGYSVRKCPRDIAYSLRMQAMNEYNAGK